MASVPPISATGMRWSMPNRSRSKSGLPGPAATDPSPLTAIAPQSALEPVIVPGDRIRTGTEPSANTLGNFEFQNQATLNPTRAAMTRYALASYRITSSTPSQLLVLHRKMFRLPGPITGGSFLLENWNSPEKVGSGSAFVETVKGGLARPYGGS